MKYLRTLILKSKIELLVLTGICLAGASEFWYQISPHTYTIFTINCYQNYGNDLMYGTCVNFFKLRYGTSHAWLIICLVLAGIFGLSFIYAQFFGKQKTS